MKQFTIIYIYPDDDRIGSIEVQAETQDDSFLVAAKALAYQELDEVDMIVSLLGTTAMNQWMGPAADGWRTCNVEDYLQSMDETKGELL